MEPRDPADPDDLLHELERRAWEAFPPEEDDDPVPDLLAAAGAAPADAELRDLTLGGYLDRHNRVPAFEGCDGQPYTVDVDVEAAESGTDFAAFLVFIRWAATGAGIMDHLESGDLAHGANEAEARAAALDLSLYEVKAELDQAIERRREALEG